MFSKYYQDELNYLRAMGVEYARRHPQNASQLGARARDPDVERLLQGFSFLTARLHERFDDQFSQVAEGFLSVLWPEALKPVPSLTMVQFQPDAKVMRSDALLPKGLELHSLRQEWGRSTFRTCRDTRVYPFSLESVELVIRENTEGLRFVFQIHSGANLQDCQLGSLPIMISGDDTRFTYSWFLWFTQNIRMARLVSPDTEQQAEVQISPVGFDAGAGLFPGSDREISGHRILRDFMASPESFLFFEINDISSLHSLGIENRFELHVDFDKRITDASMRAVNKNSFQLYCTPAVNLFEATARVTLDHTRSEYVVRADNTRIENHEVYSILDVTGFEHGTSGRRIKYQPFYTRTENPQTKNRPTPIYRERFADIQVRRGNQALKGRECFISLEDEVWSDRRSLRVQSVELKLLCMQRGGASDLRQGQLCEPSEKVPAWISFTNLTRPAMHRPAPTSGRNQWLLVSGFTMSRQSFCDLENLKAALRFHAGSRIETEADAEQWLEGLVGLEVKRDVSIENGIPLRVLKTLITFDCETDRTAEFYLFGAVLCEFLKNMASINTRLDCHIGYKHRPRERYNWKRRGGSCPLL